MKKTKKKKRRLRVGRLILLLLIIGAISFSCYKFIDVPIRSIEVTGNEILSDSEIIKAASLDNDPSFFSVISILVKNKLKENPYIKDAKVSKGFLSVKIKVKEKKVLYIKKDTGEIHSIFYKLYLFYNAILFLSLLNSFSNMLFKIILRILSQT